MVQQRRLYRSHQWDATLSCSLSTIVCALFFVQHSRLATVSRFVLTKNRYAKQHRKWNASCTAINHRSLKEHLYSLTHSLTQLDHRMALFLFIENAFNAYHGCDKYARLVVIQALATTYKLPASILHKRIKIHLCTAFFVFVTKQAKTMSFSF